LKVPVNYAKLAGSKLMSKKNKILGLDNSARKYNISVLNRAYTRDYALDLCSKLRPQFTRVSPDFIDELEDVVKTLIKEKILFVETKSKTLK